MGAETDVVGGRSVDLSGCHGWIIVKHAVSAWVGSDGVEVRLGQVETDGEDADEAPSKCEAGLPVCNEIGFEGWAEVRSSVPDELFTTNERADGFRNLSWIFGFRVVLRGIAPTEALFHVCSKKL